MGFTVAEKLISASLVEGEMIRGSRIGLLMNQTLTHDVTGVMAYMAFEATGLHKVKTDLSVSYIDHNILQSDFKNADDHHYLMDIARKIGVLCSRPASGICHQLHAERFSIPGKSLLGSDSHTVNGGGIGMLDFSGFDLEMGNGPVGRSSFGQGRSVEGKSHRVRAWQDQID